MKYLVQLLLALVCLAVEQSQLVGQTSPSECAELYKSKVDADNSLSANATINLARCYLKEDLHQVDVPPLLIAHILSDLNYEYEMDLLDSVVAKLIQHDTSSVEVRALVYDALGQSARKSSQYESAIKYLRLSRMYYTDTVRTIAMLLTEAYLHAQLGAHVEAERLYKIAMGRINPTLKLEDEKYYNFTNLSAAVLREIGSEEEAVKNFRELVYSNRTTARQKAMAAFNSIDLHPNINNCDSIRVYSKIISSTLKEPFVENELKWLLMSCLEHLDSIPASLKLSEELVYDAEYIARPVSIMIRGDIASVRGDRTELRKLMLEYNGPHVVLPHVYIAENFIRGWFRNEDPELSQALDSYLSYKDSLHSVEKRELLGQYEVSQDLQLKEAEALNLQETIIADRKARNVQYILLAIFVALTIALIVLFRTARSKSQALALQKLQVETLNRELNHRTANQLALAYELVLDQRRQIGDAQAKALLSRSENQLMTLSTVNRALAHRADALVQADTVLAQVAERLQKASPFPFSLNLDLDPITLEGDEATHVCLILSELIHNSIKYAFKGNEEGAASVVLKREQESTVLRYSDNGPGRGAKADPGEGSSLLQALVQMLDGTMVESQSNGGGYEVEMKW